ARLTAHPAFALTNPNRVRALIGSFAFGNPTQFARPDGAGFALVADTVRALDSTNPQVAAKLLTAFGSWRRLKKTRACKAEEILKQIKTIPGLSRDVADIAARSLAPINHL
ncbi:aminopeptidase N C-terminal domain-containing protein, partial [Methylobacterium hispanicum]